jgi:hypothetical protein
VTRMAGPAMRRLTAGLIVVSFALVGGLPLPAAFGQTPPAVTMRLISQSPWNDADHSLAIAFEATNESETSLESLKVVLIIHAPARSRSLYELSLTQDATSVLAAYPYPEDGSLEPGESRTFDVVQPLDVLQALGESVIYPLQIQLTSEDAPVGTIRSPLIFLSEHPQVPLNLAWTWVLSAPIEYRPDGVFLNGTLEADIAPGGRLDGLVGALERAGRTRLDLVMSSVLADQLDRMAGGYRILDPDGTIRTVERGEGGSGDATALLSRVRGLAERQGVEVIASPFGDPRLPALMEAGLAVDLPVLFDRGRSTVEAVLRRAPVENVVRPPLSQLDAASMAKLEEIDATTLVVDHGFIPPPEEPLPFSPPAVVRVSSVTTSVAAVVPDPQVQAIAASLSPDPVLAAHSAVGELAATWLELPGTAGRGAAVLFPENPRLPLDLLQEFATLVRTSPWLRPAKVSRFVTLVPEQAEPQPLPIRTYREIGPDYLGRLVRAKSSLAQFGRTAVDSGTLTERLGERLLIAEAGTFVAEPPLGEAFIESVIDEIGRIYAGVTIETIRLTLPSQRGTIPITFSNRSGFRLNVRLRFSTDRRLQFVGGTSHRITLPISSRTLTFAVRAQTTGHIPFTVRLVTDGTSQAGDTIAEADMVIRSTAYNRVALIFTIGAALFLLLWWGRRFLPRRKAPGAPTPPAG